MVMPRTCHECHRPIRREEDCKSCFPKKSKQTRRAFLARKYDMNIAKYFSDGLSVIPCGDSGHSVLHGCNQSSRIYEQVNGNWITGSLFHEPCKEAMASMQECIWAGKDFHYTWADREYVIKFSILKDFHLEEYLKHGKVITLN